VPLVALLWLALLQALCIASPPSGGGSATAPRARVERGLDRPERGDAARAEAPDAALHAARVVTTATLARPSGATTHGGTGAPALDWTACPRIDEAGARRILARYADASHAASARGGLLPYFPTAPPFRG